MCFRHLGLPGLGKIEASPQPRVLLPWTLVVQNTSGRDFSRTGHSAVPEASMECQSGSQKRWSGQIRTGNVAAGKPGRILDGASQALGPEREAVHAGDLTQCVPARRRTGAPGRGCLGPRLLHFKSQTEEGHLGNLGLIDPHH